MEKTMDTTIGHYFKHLTCTLLVVLGLLGILAPASQAATGAFSFSAANYSANEGAGYVDITINRVGGSTGTATVQWRTFDETARTGRDFSGFGLTTLSFAAGETKKIQRIKITDDTLIEPNETFIIRLYSPTNGTTLGSTARSVVTILDNDTIAVDRTAPTVSLTSPASTTFTSAQTVTIAASATDNVGVSKVELYDGATLKGTDITAPYSFAWAITTADNGNHSFSAKAYDAAGNVATSAVKGITVNIAVAAPAVYTTPVLNPVTISNGNYQLSWSLPTTTYGVPSGGYDIFVDGVDDNLHHTTLSAVKSGLKQDVEHCFVVEARWTQATPSVFPSSNKVCVPATPIADVTRPTVSLTSPASTTFTSAQTVTITASASDNVGVSKVELYNGATLVATDTTSPYSFAWTITTANNGNHSLSAKAYDAAGNVAISTAVGFTVNIAVAPPVYDPSTRTPLSLRIDPSFTVDSLPADTRLWYNRFLAGMRNTNQYPNATTLAKSNDTYNYGRPLNTHITTIMQMLRVTGDPKLLEEIDRLAELMRGQLKDWSILTKDGTTYKADGYLNWLYNYDAPYVGTDVHQMDELLSHSLVASIAYTFHVNRDLNPRYAERAQFWTNYLKNHFEAKWRKRNNKATGYPFLEKNLTHAYMQWVRYHYYMAKLTGDKSYETEALRMAGNLNNQIKQVSTSIGAGSMWDHGMTVLGVSSYGAQPTSYARYTVQGAADLAAEGFSIFGQAGYMERMSVTLAHYVMDGNLSAYAGNINGSDSGTETLDRYSISPWPMLGRWDKTGEIKVETDRVYRKIEAAALENPRRIYLPAGMVYLLSR